MPSRPSFAKDFPRTPEVDSLVDDFARGDYARVRAQAPRLARSDDPETQRAVQTLVKRTNADPLALAMLALAALLLVVLAGFWIANGKPPPAETPATSVR